VQLYERFRKCRSIPASNFEFTPYQELSSGYYNFQSDRRKTFFSLGDRKVEAKTTMPYFLCTDYAQMIFRLGHEVFDKDFRLLFLGGETWADSELRRIQDFANEHGLISAHEWVEQAMSIRDYRPLLSRKQKRVLHDELTFSRVEWIQLCHKRESSVMMQFDPNSSVTEHAIDLHFASLVDIKSIYLPRDLDGSLKGTATLVCASPAAAKQMLALFKLSNDVGQGHIEEYLDDKGEIVIKQKSDLTKLKKDFLKKAAEWLYINRRIQDEELVVPFELPEIRSDSDHNPAAQSPPHSRLSTEQCRTALLIEWHQQRIQHKMSQNDVIKREHSESTRASQSSEAKTKYLSVFSRGCNGRSSAANVLLDSEVMYVVLKNAKGNGCTLCQWIGKEAHVNQRKGSKKHPAQVQKFLRSSIPKLHFDLQKYETKDDFLNPQASAIVGDNDGKDDALAGAKQKAKKQATLKNIEFENDIDVSRQLLSLDSGSGEFDWIVFRYTDAVKWDEWETVESPKKRTESSEKELAALRTDSVSCDIEYEQKLFSACPESDSLRGKFKTRPKLLQRLGQQVFCFKANNSAQARRLRQMLPNLDSPNHTILWSSSAPSSVFSKTEGRGSTVSLIVRDDVSDASVLQFLQKILDKTLLPSIRSRSEVNLRACDSTDIQWLDINGAVIESRKWKLRSFQFRSTIEVDYTRYLAYWDNSKGIQDNDFQWERERFRQPFSQPILDLIFLRRDFHSFRKLKFDIKKMLETHFVWKKDRDERPRILLTVTGSDDTTHWFLVCSNGNTKVLDPKDKVKNKQNRKKNVSDFKGWTISMDQNCLANFLFSDVLNDSSMHEKFKAILEHGKNFWGRPISFSWNWNKKDSPIIQQASAEVEADAEARAIKVTNAAADEFWKVQTTTEAEADCAGNHAKAKADAADEFWKVLGIWRKRAVISIFEHSCQDSSGSNIYSSEGCCCAGSEERCAEPSGAGEAAGAGAELCGACEMKLVSCFFCGCNYVIPSCVREALGRETAGHKSCEGFFCCISHADREEKRTKLLMPITNFNKPDKIAHNQVQDPARDKNLAKLFQRICELEKLLLLNISIGFQHILLFKCSATNKLSPIRIQCRFQRDEYDGPAHLSFYIEGPTGILCQRNADVHELSATEARKTRSKKKADKKDYIRDLHVKEGVQVTVSSSQPFEGFSCFKTSLSVYPEFHDRESPLFFRESKQKIKTHMSRVYGRLAPKDNGVENGVSTNNEGNKLPAEWMRRLMEPEYYQSSSAAFPVLKFSLTIPRINDPSSGSAFELGDHFGTIASNETYVAETTLPYFEELGLSDKNSKQDNKPGQDRIDNALRCFRDVLNAESQLNAVIASLGLLSEQFDASLKQTGAVAAGGGLEDDCDDDDGDDDGDDDQDDDCSSTRQHHRIIEPKSGCVVFLKNSSKRGVWMELFHPPQKSSEPLVAPFFSDIIRMQLDFPSVHTNQKSFEGLETSLIACCKRCHDPQASKNLNYGSVFQFFKLMRNFRNHDFNPDDAIVLLDSVSSGGSCAGDDTAPTSSHDSAAFPDWVGRSCAASSCSATVVTASASLAFLAKSLMDHLITKNAQAAFLNSEDVPICIFKQQTFPDHIKTFLFGQKYTNVTLQVVTADVSATLSRFLQPKLDLSFQLAVKQQHFEETIDAILGDVAVKEGTAVEGRAGALVACKTIQKSLDDLKLLEAFKYFLVSDDLFCKVRMLHFHNALMLNGNLRRV
jgi:hypothetical protein